MASKPSVVEIVNTDSKKWVKVTFDNGTEWYPGLIHLGQIISGIGKCEDAKYPDGRGHEMTKDFLNKCWGKTRTEIKSLYYEDFDPKGTDAKNKGECKSCHKLPAETESGLCELCAAAEEGWRKP